jgi:hypothetical protein
MYENTVKHDDTLPLCMLPRSQVFDVTLFGFIKRYVFFTSVDNPYTELISMFFARCTQSARKMAM